eukprot:m.134397 g.134397  ORF g.134397 m.134397 type:complete len:198 (-) comp9590_c0_seq1:233-826(-)
MSVFAHKGGVALIFALLTAGLCVAALFPHVFWVKTDKITLTPGVTIELKSSLWLTCNTTTIGTNPAIVTSGCTKVVRPKDFLNGTSYTNAKTSEERGAIAGLVIGGLFTIITLLTACCKSKCGTVVVSLIGFIFVGAGVATYVVYKRDYLDSSKNDGLEYHLTYGFFMACVAAAFSLLSCFGGCCINKERVAYHQMA